MTAYNVKQINNNLEPRDNFLMTQISWLFMMKGDVASFNN